MIILTVFTLWVTFIFFRRWCWTAWSWATSCYHLSRSPSILRATWSWSSIITCCLFSTIISLFIFHVELFTIQSKTWLCNINLYFFIYSPYLYCLIIAARENKIWQIWCAINLIYHIAMTLVSSPLYSTSWYFVQQFTSISFPNIDTGIFTSWFWSAYDKWLLYSRKTWCYYTLIL